MIIVTGGAGFIGSNVVHELNQQGYPNKSHQLIVVDNLKHSEYPKSEKWKNLRKLKFTNYMDKDDFINWIYNRLHSNMGELYVAHLGANTDTNERNMDFLIRNNTKYSSSVLNLMEKKGGRMVYASSAATYAYGLDSNFDDNNFDLYPLNQYGYSKHLFDLEVNKRNLDNVVGFKLFNVYGPNEYHKGNMSSPIYTFFNQLMKTGYIQIFDPDDFNRKLKRYKNLTCSKLKRDFIYVKDCSRIICDTLLNHKYSGIYNLGTELASSWEDIANIVVHSVVENQTIKNRNASDQKDWLVKKPFPDDMVEGYQPYTCSNNRKLRKKINLENMTGIEDGIKDYIDYLMSSDPYR